MNPPRSEGFVRMPDAEFEAIICNVYFRRKPTSCWIEQQK